jgi:hypothetical protein
MRIEDVNEQLGLELPSGEYDTVAGFIFSHLGHIPKEGEQMRYNKLKAKVAYFHLPKSIKLGRYPFPVTVMNSRGRMIYVGRKSRRCICPSDHADRRGQVIISGIPIDQFPDFRPL